MTKEKKSFHDSISTLLNEKLKVYVHEPLNKDLCYRIYAELFETLTGLFQTTNTPLGNEAANYVAQQYYDGISINKNEEQLDPNIFTQRAKLENIPTKELALMAMMLEGTDFRLPVMEEIKRRS